MISKDIYIFQTISQVLIKEKVRRRRQGNQSPEINAMPASAARQGAFTITDLMQKNDVRANRLKDLTRAIIFT